MSKEMEELCIKIAALFANPHERTVESRNGYIRGFNQAISEVLSLIDESGEPENTRARYLEVLRERVNALVHAGEYDQMGRNFYVKLDDVLNLIDEEKA